MTVEICTPTFHLLVQLIQTIDVIFESAKLFIFFLFLYLRCFEWFSYLQVFTNYMNAAFYYFYPQFRAGKRTVYSAKK